MKKAPSILKEVFVTYGEITSVLTQLGYRNESNEERYHFVNDKYKSMVDLPPYSLEDVVKHQFLAIYSYQLFMQGVIKDEESLVKKVLQNRVKVRLVANAA